MKILVLAKKPPYPPHDGEAIAIMQMAVGLCDAGNEVTMLYMNTAKHSFNPQEIPEQYRQKIKFQAVYVHAGISLIKAAFNLFSSLPYHLTRFYSKSFDQTLIEILSQDQFDIVQCEGLFLTAYSKTIRRHSKALIIYRSHNVEGMIWKRFASGEKRKLRSRFIHLQAKKLLAYEKSVDQITDAVVPISNYDQKFYETIFTRNKIKYSPAGIDLHQYETLQQGKVNHRNLYFLGGLDWLPNQEGLFWFVEKVLPLVLQHDPEITFHIAGRNGPAGFSKLNDGKNIIYDGEVSDASEFVSDKFICIVPLFSGSGMKIKIVEAMAQNKLVITTPVGAEGMPEGLTDHLIICDTAESFAEKISWALDHPAEGAAIASAGRNFVLSSLDNTQLTSELTEFYQSLRSTS